MDALANGRRIKCLTIVDDFTRECLDIAVDYGISGGYVARVLEAIGQFRGLPQAIRTDQGTEFTSRALDRWAYGCGVDSSCLPPASRRRTRISRALTASFGTSALMITTSTPLPTRVPLLPSGDAITTRRGRTVPSDACHPRNSRLGTVCAQVTGLSRQSFNPATWTLRTSKRYRQRGQVTSTAQDTFQRSRCPKRLAMQSSGSRAAPGGSHARADQRTSSLSEQDGFPQPLNVGFQAK